MSFCLCGCKISVMTQRNPKNINKNKKSRRQKRKLFPIILTIAGIVLVGIIIYAVFFLKSYEPPRTEKYLAGTDKFASVYYYDDYEKRLFRIDDQIRRGSKVSLTGEIYSEYGVDYEVVEYEGETFYVKSEYLVDEGENLVRETEKWVRTPVTVYKEKDSSDIASYFSKGTHIDILSYDQLQEDGSINMYQVSSGDVTGWVYSKYLADSKKEAEAVNEEIYSIHANRAYGSELYGGAGSDLDWYPVEKASFENNKIIGDCRGMYLCGSAVQHIDDYIEIAKSAGVNAMVIDVKENGSALCDLDVFHEYSPLQSQYVHCDPDYAKEAFQKVKDAGLYLILRIVVFKDELYAKANPENTIDSDSANVKWPSAFCRGVWEYNVKLAEEVIEKFKPNEIQFDYVRFPEEAYTMSQDPSTDFRNTYDESKVQAIQNFVYYACDRIHTHDVYVSIDVFAESTSKYIPAYGQYFPAISNVADAVSAMPYTDHYGQSNDTWSDPYSTISNWAASCAARQKEIETPGIARTWLTGYNVPWWNPQITCNSDYVKKQAQALYDNDVNGGFMLWNGASSMEIYRSCAEGWRYDYTSKSTSKTTSSETSEASEESEEETPEEETSEEETAE